jgi:DNA-directed RNA polymerase subunit RPC12/RpoP
MREAHDAALVCVDCRSPLSSSLETDGQGRCIEMVRPCPHCRSRLHFVVREPRPTNLEVEFRSLDVYAHPARPLVRSNRRGA